MSRRCHRLERQYPALWRAVDGAIRSAQHAHPDIVIPNRASLVKRVVGQALAATAGAGKGAPADTARLHSTEAGASVRARPKPGGA